MDASERSNDAPSRSSLLMKHTRGTLKLSAWCHTVSDCGSTPATPSNTTTPPSRTRKDLCTSAVKSTCPGVSIILILYLLTLSVFGNLVGVQKQVVAAEVMVIPLSLSCSIQSIIASPS